MLKAKNPDGLFQALQVDEDGRLMVAGGPSGGGSAAVSAVAGNNSADYSSNSSTFATPAGLTINVPAAEGDRLLIEWTGSGVNPATNTLELGIAVDGTTISTRVQIGNQAANPIAVAHVIRAVHVVQASEIDGGNVTVAALIRSVSGGTISVYNSGNFRPVLTVTNLGA